MIADPEAKETNNDNSTTDIMNGESRNSIELNKDPASSVQNNFQIVM